MCLRFSLQAFSLSFPMRQLNTRAIEYTVSENTLVLGVSLLYSSINSTSQSNCQYMSVRVTLFIENRRLHLFGLTNNQMGSFIVSSSMAVLSVSLSEAPLQSVPKLESLQVTKFIRYQCTDYSLQRLNDAGKALPFVFPYVHLITKLHQQSTNFTIFLETY